MLKFMRISKRMILGVVCSIAGSTLSFFVPLLIKDFIDNKKFDLSLLYVFPFLFAAQFILCAIGGLLISTEADLHVAELRIQAMDIIFEKDMLFFDNENSGEIASGIVYDISLVRNFVAASIPQFVSSVINILFSVVALTVINYRLSILVLIIFPAVMIMEFLNEEFLRRLSQGSDMVCTFNGGLFGGYVGLLPAAIALRDLGIDDELWERIIDGLNLYLMKNNGNIVFPGLYGYKCSMDLGTGSAGVLLALSDSGRSGEWGSWMPVLENEDFSLFRV